MKPLDETNLEQNREILRRVVNNISHPNHREIFGSLGVFCRKLSSIRYGVHESSIYIPSGAEAEMLASATGCRTAFMTESPPQIVVFNEMMNKLSTLGTFFAVSHELAHFVFLHFNRRQKRDPVLWNIYGDKQINQVLTKTIIPAVHNKMKKGPTAATSLDLNNGYALFRSKDDFVPFVGFTPDTKNWFTSYADTPEEHLYEVMRNEAFSKTVRHDFDKRQNGMSGQNSQGSGNGNGSGQSTSPLMPQPENLDYDSSSAADVDNHMQDSVDIRNELENKYGEAGRQLADKMGLPKTKEELEKTRNKVRTMVERSVEEARSSRAAFDGYVSEAFSRDTDSRAQAKFNLTVSNIFKKAKRDSNIWDRTGEPNYISRLSRYGNSHEFLRFKGKIDIPEEEQVSPNLRILTILDTSGSVMQEEITKNYLNEIRNLVLAYDSTLVVVAADTESRGAPLVINRDNIDEYEENGFTLGGGGGTDMLRPLAQELAQAEEPYSMAVVLSDGGDYAFTKEELSERIREFSDRKKYPNGHTPQALPYIAYLNTRPMFDPEANTKFATFPKNSFGLFTLNTGEDVVINATVGANKKNKSNDFNM